MAEQINQLMEWNRPPTFLGRLKDLFIDNFIATLFMIIVVAFLGYVGLSWLLG